MAKPCKQNPKKSKKQIQQVVKAKFLKKKNVIELFYVNDNAQGCKTPGHGSKKIPNLSYLYYPADTRRKPLISRKYL